MQPGGLALLGVPSSAGALTPGQERAPAALREAGLVEALRAQGLEIADFADSLVRTPRPEATERANPDQELVREVALETADRVRAAEARIGPLLIFGGDATLDLGVVAGLVADGQRLGLIHFDSELRLKTPQDAPGEAFEAMVVAHLIAEEGAATRLSRVGPRVPLLEEGEVFFLGHALERAHPSEREMMERFAMSGIEREALASDPGAAPGAALRHFGPAVGRLVVHFGLGVLGDGPLAEKPGGEGLSFPEAMTTLAALLADDRVAALTVTALNPARGEPADLEGFATGLARALSGGISSVVPR